MIIPVLAYHEVYETEEEKDFCAGAMAPSCSIASDIFRQQLEVIHGNMVKVSTFGNILEPVGDLPDEAKRLILTFDDGHQGNYDYVYPLLKHYDFPAVFFVATDLIGTRNMMTWSQLREMADHGMSIQSHGVSHEPFEMLSCQQVREELHRSKEIIEDMVGKEVDTISLPHGSIHRKTFDIAEQVGYRFVCTSLIDYFHCHQDQCNVVSVPRISIHESMDLAVFAGIVTGHCREVKKWQRVQKIKYVIKRLVGINNYRKVYRLIHGIGLR